MKRKWKGAECICPTYKAVSCICPTFGRRSQLNETVYSFLNQDYKGVKELLIVNDNPNVEYVFDHPEVRIINLGTRFATLGEKLNFCVGNARHPWIIQWADDDIVLPWATSLQVRKLQKKPSCSFAPEGYYCLMHAHNRRKGGQYTIGTKHLVGIMGFCKILWKKIGGFPSIDVSEDVGFKSRMADDLQYFPLTPEEYYYIWRVNCGWTQMSKNKKQWNTHEKGRIEIKPEWKRDYTHDIQDMLIGVRHRLTVSHK